MRKAERWFGVENLSDMANNELLHHINAALRAHALMKRDVDYVVQNDEVVIVDEFTGRLMVGRRYTATACTRPSRPRNREGAAREQDAGDRHLPELFPHVQPSSPA